MEEKSQINVPRVKLGSQGLEVSRLGFGCAGLSGYYNASIPHEAGCSIIKEAFSKGITLFDTADIYGDDHDNEIMVGKALKQLPRDKIQLATKFGFFKSGEEIGVKGTPEYVRECCEASLKRLGVDYIDLYYQHRVDTSVPIEDTMGELKKLVEEGKIKYIGLSEASVDTIRRVYVVHPITVVQMEYSLWVREIEEDIIFFHYAGYTSKVHWGELGEEQAYIFSFLEPGCKARLHPTSISFGMASPSRR
ncbi:hypothetical protein Q3G72_032538 [Acer saccharum]|nr:hypothetical protein Q3G72_032538 [Acer saccharum]